MAMKKKTVAAVSMVVGMTEMMEKVMLDAGVDC
jgi:hypothetical protein